MRKELRKKIQLAKATYPSKKKKIQDELIQIEKGLIKSHQRSKENEKQKTENTVKNNSYYFYNYLMLKMGIGPLITGDGELVDDPTKMIDILVEQNSSVFSTLLRYQNINDDKSQPTHKRYCV